MKPDLERKIRAFELRQSGMKWADIGKTLGVSPSRAQQLAQVGERVKASRAPSARSSEG